MSVASGVVLTLSGMFVSAVVPVYASNIMGPSEYGTLAFLQGLTVLISIVSLLGADGYALRSIPRAIDQRDSRAAWTIVFIGLGFAVAISLSLIIGIRISSDLLRTHTSLLQLALLVPCVTITYFLSFCLQGVRASVLGATIRNPLVFSTFTIAAIVLLRASWRDVTLGPVITSLALSYAILMAASFYELRARIGKLAGPLGARRKPELRDLYGIGTMLKASIPMLAFSSSFYLMFQADIIILGYMADAHDISAYAFASRLSALSSVGLLTVNIFLPQLIARLSSQTQGNVLQQVLKASVWFSNCVFFVMVAFIALAAPSMAAVAGVADSNWLVCLVILLVGQFANVFTGSCGYLLTMTGNQNVAASVTIAAAGANALLNIGLIPVFGMVGSAIATAVALGAANIYMAWKALCLTGNSSLLVCPWPVRTSA